ncbi:2-hydroxychromene-2-carboxylate isomerase [Ottowia thiooxydans]|uniref:2-hydroxychromene-2-carboxylate isomerase n=1 Tax=Ottowia thiooxydans TaxID=219182 RepID=UPI00048CCBF9|nr:2-hydroxychromene-2-carboxylate isomerase [Ottowia thiooxydans]
MFAESEVAIDCYYSVRSVYAYFGAARIIELARRTGRKLRHFPIDLSQVVPAYGSTPFAERSARRRAHQFEVEVKRWSEWLKIPVIVHPVYHRGDRLLPSCCVLAAQALGEDVDGFSLAVLTALWRHDRDIGNADVLASIAQDCGVSARAMLDLAHSEQVQLEFQQCTERAIAQDVPGSPTYVIGNELFYGQDRLMFVEHHLTHKASSQ